MLGLIYSQTFQNLFCGFIMYGTVNVISTEVSKCIGSGSTTKVPKILLYNFIFGIFYILLVFLPATLFCDQFLKLTTNLSPEVLEITRRTNFLTFFPMVLSCTYLGVSTYFQTLGLSSLLGKYNMFFALSAIGAVLIYIRITSNFYQGYLLITWLLPLLQIACSVFLYFVALLPSARISNLKIDLKDFGYVMSRILGNVLVEFIEGFDSELLVIMSSLWLSKAENKAFNFSFQIFFMAWMGAIPFLRLIYCAFSEFLGESRPRIAKIAYLLTSVIYLGTNLMICLPFLAGYPLACKYALQENEEARKLLPVLLLSCIFGQFARTHLSYTFEIMKGLDLRTTSLAVLMVKNVAFVGLCYLLTNVVHWRGVGLYIGFFGSNFAMDLGYNIILVFINWKKRLDKLRML